MRASILIAAAVLLAGCEAESPTAQEETAAPARGEVAPGPIALPTGELAELTVIDVRTGDGEPVDPGETAVVHYTGWLYDADAGNRRGQQFDSSRGGQPFSFPLGEGRVIRGWDEGVAGMRVGGRRYLFIPPQYGYGERGAGGVIPPNATLFFDVELIEVQ